MKLTKSTIDRAEYQGLPLRALEKRRRREEISDGEYVQTRAEMLAPFHHRGKDGRPKWRRYVLWDSEVPGLGLRVTPSGRKTFVLSYRHRGIKRLMALGRYGGGLTLHQARELAQDKLHEKTKGTDPLLERREGRRRAKEAKTVSDLCEAFLERHSKASKKTWRDDHYRVEKYIKPRLGALRLEDVTRARIDQLYREIGSEHPYAANRVLALLSAMFNLAPEWGFLPEGWPNPARVKKAAMYRERRRDRPVKDEELPGLLQAIEAEPNPYVRGLFQLLLLTGLRKSEWLRAKRDDIDYGRGTLRLAETKAGQPRHVPLSSAALEILRRLPPRIGNPYLFPSSAKPGVPLADVRRAWHRIRESAGCPDLRIHDLRHSVATWLSEAGNPAQAIQQALGHRNIEQSMGYVHASDRAPREALERLGERIDSASPPEENDED